MSLLNSMEKLRSDRALLESLIEENSLGAVFQPVRELDGGALVGYKAIARGPLGTELETATGLLSSAQATGYVERLDWMFRCAAFEAALEVRLDGDLFVTPEVETFGSPCPPRLAATLGRARRELHVVADLPARAADEPQRLRSGVREFRGYGWQVVIGDVADVPGVVALLDEVKPDAVWLDLDLPGRTAGVGCSERVATIVAWARETGATLLADNVDSEARRADARAMGAKAGRGRLLGLPGPLG